MRKAILILLIGLLSLISTASAQSDAATMLRFVHAVPGAPAVDVYINGELTVVDLGYGETSTYLSAPVGTHEVNVTASGTNNTVWQQQIEALEDLPQTLIASSADAPAFVAFDDDFTPVEIGTTRFKAIHALNGGPAVDIQAGEDTITSGLTYGDFIGTFDIPANTYNFTVFPTGETEDAALFSQAPFDLTSNTSQMLIVYGTADAPAAMLLAAPLAASEESGFIRIAHTISGAPAVDIYTDGTLLAPGLSFGETTEHLALPAGTYAVEVRATGTDNALLEETLDVEAGGAATVAAYGTLDSPVLGVFADEIGGIDATTALVTVLNTVPGDSSATVALADGTTLGADVAAGESAEVVTVDPTITDVILQLSIGGQSATLELGSQTLYGGVYYNAIVLPSTPFSAASVLFAPTSLAQSVGSAPAAAAAPETVVEAPTEAPTEAQATPETQEATPEEQTEVEQPAATEAPVVEAPPTAVPQPTTPPVTEEPPAITARVLLDPGANLQLRQLPSVDALSLGLAPSGSILEVIGREGPDVDFEGRNIEPDFADPAVGLPENQDLNPETIWVKFIYFTPDGGQISAWNLAQYLVIQDQENEDVRLADLPLVPGNSAGEAIDTAVTPPPVLENRVTVEAVNLNPGVNLNIRRTPENDGQVLARVPSGTIMDLIGIGQSGEWYFVSYVTVDGGTVTGWVNQLYAELRLNGQPSDIQELDAEGITLLADEGNDRGSVDATSTSAAIVPTAPAIGQQSSVEGVEDTFIAEVRLNPDANLNLRRTPNANSEVLIRIPSGSSVIVTGRTDTGNWLATSFEGIEGWIASEFVFVSFNGAEAELAEIPVVGTDAETVLDNTGAGNNPPAASPEATVEGGLLPGECPVEGDAYLPARVQAGANNARAIATLTVFSRPSINGNVIGEITSGTVFDEIVGGPICNQGFRWWLIQEADTRGWVQESDVSDGTYLIEPAG